MKQIQPRQSPPLDTLLDDLKTLIDQARWQVAAAVNAALTLLYWQVGQRIRTDLLLEQDRAAYGEQILATLSQQLTRRYGKGFTKSALNRMVKFAEVFPESQIVATLSQQLSWSHFVLLLPLDKPMQRDYYAEMCRIEGWSVRTLGARIDSMLYERTALSRKPDALIRNELRAGSGNLNKVASSDAIVIRPVDKKLHGLVLMTVSSDEFVAVTAQQMKEGSKMPRADWKQMQAYSAPLPPSAVLTTFGGVIQPIIAQLKALSFSNQKLRAARDLLLPRLTSGEIAV